MRIIKKDNKIIAMVLDGKFEEGTKPLTDESWPLQIINLKHSKGKVLASHFHKPMVRTTKNLMEALFVVSGKIKVTIYYKKKIVEKIDLLTCQGIMLVDGGIGIEIIEDTEMIEFKNGPFIEDKKLI